MLLLLAGVEPNQREREIKRARVFILPTASSAGVPNLALAQVLPIWIAGTDTFRDKRKL